MKRYLIFLTRCYDASGGMNDFKGSTDTLSKIKDFGYMEEFFDIYDEYDIVHIFDTVENLYYELEDYSQDSKDERLVKYNSFIHQISSGELKEKEYDEEEYNSIKCVSLEH